VAVVLQPIEVHDLLLIDAPENGISIKVLRAIRMSYTRNLRRLNGRLDFTISQREREKATGFVPGANYVCSAYKTIGCILAGDPA
jgi:hypothetical protein